MNDIKNPCLDISLQSKDEKLLNALKITYNTLLFYSKKPDFSNKYNIYYPNAADIAIKTIEITLRDIGII